MKKVFFSIIAVLFFISAVLVSYRIVVLDYPLFPTAPGDSWEISISSRLSKSPANHALAVVGLPIQRTGLTILSESYQSGTLNVGVSREGPNRLAIFSGRSSEDSEFIGYRAFLISLPQKKSAQKSPLTLAPYPDAFGKAEQELAMRLVGQWRNLPSGTRLKAVGGTIRGEWRDAPPVESDLKAWSEVQQKHGRVVSLLGLLRAAGLHARGIEGLRLVRSMRNEPLRLVEAWSGSRWVRLRPETGEELKIPGSLLVLARGGARAIEAREGTVSDTRWNVSELTLSNWRRHFERILRSDNLLDRWSFFHLPREFQDTFRILLLVPIGALLIGILRNIVGFPTFGVFMPVLMALAFRSTGVIYGLAIFAGMMGIGYFLRNALDNMRLLLVPRLSVMLTAVISALTILALVGNKIGLREFMAVGLLPFVILTMVIERFFIMVEESGIRTAMQTALGSAAVAVISYGILHFEELQLTFFIYPELLFGIAAFQLLLGRYTGYRLSELIRFKSFRGAS